MTAAEFTSSHIRGGKQCPGTEIQCKCRPRQYCSTYLTRTRGSIKMSIKTVNILVMEWVCGRSLCLTFLQMICTGHKYKMLRSCFSTANHLKVWWKEKKSQVDNITKYSIHPLQLFTRIQRKLSSWKICPPNYQIWDFLFNHWFNVYHKEHGKTWSLFLMSCCHFGVFSLA